MAGLALFPVSRALLPAPPALLGVPFGNGNYTSFSSDLPKDNKAPRPLSPI
jgi:hypothetical protein